MKLRLGVALAGLLLAGGAAAQPLPQLKGQPIFELKGAVATKKRLSILDRIDKGTVRDVSQVPLTRPFDRLIDDRLTSALGTAKLEQFRLAQIRKLRADPNFFGIIDSMNVGDTRISLERRNVRTEKGLLPLLLTNIDGRFIYDGDMVVPPLAITGLGSAPGATVPGRPIVFSAGVAGTFGSGSLWDDAIIPFEVASDFCCSRALADAIADYEERTIFRFVPRDRHETYVKFINSEFSFLTSQTELGKQRGENTLRIQGFRSADGEPIDRGTMARNIQHEIGHELGLIHEHLRTDRDQFIARNPSCAPSGSVFDAIVDGWIDLTQSAFTDGSAELLTEYDFDSMMHYQFLAATTGGALCSTWVRIQTCPNADPTSPRCNGSFRAGGMTDLDIEGLHKLYSRVPTDVRTFTGDNVRHRGRRIDKCMHGGAPFEDTCNQTARDRVADAFCVTQGFQDGFDVQVAGLTGEHSGFDRTVGWKNVFGTEVISAISCRDPSADSVATGQEERTFLGDEIKIFSKRVDRCMHGSGIIGDRCSAANQQRIADRFCSNKRFERATGFESDFGPNAFMVGFHPSERLFKDVSGFDHFTEITCTREEGGGLPPNRQRVTETFRGGEINISGKRIDRCVHGDAIVGDRCGPGNQRKITDAFCDRQGFSGSGEFDFEFSPDADMRGFFVQAEEFRQVSGLDRFKRIDCTRPP